VSTAADADRVESALWIDSERAQSYLDVASGLLVILTAEGIVSLLNREGRQVLEDPDGELVGSDWLTEVVPPEERADARRAIGRLLAEEDAVRHLARACVAASPGRSRACATPAAGAWPCSPGRTSPSGCAPRPSCASSRSSTR
jgi:PAS domain-containing protein